MSDQPKRPNVLFLLTDDQRFDTIGRVGWPHMRTPTMDYLASRGVAFENAYIMGGTCQAVCMPSRAMLNTARTMFHRPAPARTAHRGGPIRRRGTWPARRVLEKRAPGA